MLVPALRHAKRNQAEAAKGAERQAEQNIKGVTMNELRIIRRVLWVSVRVLQFKVVS